jgi:hypothetical protein
MFKIENGKPKSLTNNLIEIVERKKIEERDLDIELHPDKIPPDFPSMSMEQNDHFFNHNSRILPTLIPQHLFS